MPKNLLLIFTRNPELGKVKSRLARDLGDVNALEIYKSLLEHTKNVVSKINCTKRVGYSVAVRPNDIWGTQVFEKFKQEGDDLGERMYNAFAKAYSDGYEKVLIIGSDLLDLRPEHIEEAFKELTSHDVVIGPAKDGGYYLLGMNQMIKEVFFHKEWGTATVFNDTIAHLREHSVYKLESLNDIDFAEDLKGYPEYKHYFNHM